ncbi:hypothetical protein [Ohessyouella blattaphilus]|uniref:Uncharacterized protein n=1 Tax=Ohessyouella blattaphilus TaxID=2949333 RepID=A0ABT1EHZ8_9FIRM|nr:hypothetical protein [Ohessyouella blattaphilus]MCP1110324.1 hypothetical protein [Ohessyouella blattaphilus]MCR8563718.1 hypothetical protein [Ohessyouella blattaphilus]
MQEMKKNEFTEIVTDTKAVKERIAEKDAKASEEFKASMEAVLNGEIESQEEINDLFAKAILSEREEREAQKNKELDEELKRHEAEIIARYEAEGLKSQATERKDERLKKWLDNIPGMND